MPGNGMFCPALEIVAHCLTILDYAFGRHDNIKVCQAVVTK